MKFQNDKKKKLKFWYIFQIVFFLIQTQTKSLFVGVSKKMIHEKYIIHYRLAQNTNLS